MAWQGEGIFRHLLIQFNCDLGVTIWFHILHWLINSWYWQWSGGQKPIINYQSLNQYIKCAVHVQKIRNLCNQKFLYMKITRKTKTTALFLTIKKGTVPLALHRLKRKYALFQSPMASYNIKTINAPIVLFLSVLFK